MQIVDVIQNHMLADIVAVVITAASVTILAYILKENKGHEPEGSVDLDEKFKSNFIYALMPILPVIILILGATGKVPALKMDVPNAMVIGAIVNFVNRQSNPTEVTKSFFNGMGNGYGEILGIIISVGVCQRYEGHGPRSSFPESNGQLRRCY